MVGQQNKGIVRMLIGIGIGAIVAFAISFGLLAIATTLILNQRLPFSALGVCCVVIHLISIYIAGFLTGVIGEYNTAIAIGGMVLCVLLVHGILGALVFNNGLGNVIGVLIPVLTAGALAVVTRNKSKEKHKRCKIKKRYL